MDPLHLIEADAVENGTFAYDFETESETGNPRDAKNPWLARPILLALASRNYSGAFEITEQLTETFRRLAMDPKLQAIAHNETFDVIVGHRANMVRYEDWQATGLDTIGYAWAVDEERPKRLKGLVWRYLHKRMVTYEEAALDNPVLRQIDALNATLTMHRENVRQWAEPAAAKTRRPYPTFDDPAMHWNSIKKQQLAELGYESTTAAPTELNKQLASWRLELFDELERWRHADYVEAFEVKADVRLRELRRQALQMLKDYAREDAEVLFPLLGKLLQHVKREGVQQWMKIEMDIRWQTIGMGIAGSTVDRAELTRRGAVIKPLAEELRGTLFNVAKEEFNPNSPEQVCTLLFWKMRLTPPVFRQAWVNGGRVPVPKLTDGGVQWCIENGYMTEDPADERIRWVNCCVDLRRPQDIPEEIRRKYISTDTITMSMLDHPIGQALLNYRTVAKLQSTYIESMGEKLDIAEDGLLHGKFNCFGTDTGRFSSSDPNLQNIPSRRKGAAFDPRIQNLGPKLRETFVPPMPDKWAPEGYVLIVSDQSQVELRVIAHFTQDFNLNAVYQERIRAFDLEFYTGDVHQKTSTSLGIPRKPAKNVNFGFNYGMGPEKFARMVPLLDDTGGYDILKATSWRDGFFQTYSGLPVYLNALRSCWDSGQRHYQMISGRFRHFNDIKVMPGKILNAKVQGSSADMIKANMYIIRKHVIPKFPGLRVVSQVHDELIYACPKRFATEAAKAIKYVMEYDWFGLTVPILADTTICPNNWAEEGDDRVPSVGVFYARVDGEDRLFDASNWQEFVDLDEAGHVDLKSSCARLLPEDVEWCKTFIPDRGPLIQAPAVTSIMSREAELALRN